MGYVPGRPEHPRNRMPWVLNPETERHDRAEPTADAIKTYERALARFEREIADPRQAAERDISFAGGGSRADRFVKRVRRVSRLWQQRLDRIDGQIARLQRQRRDMILAAFTNGETMTPAELVLLAVARADKRGPAKREMEHRLDSYWLDVDAETMARQALASTSTAGGCGIHGNRPDERCPACAKWAAR